MPQCHRLSHNFFVSPYDIDPEIFQSSQVFQESSDVKNDVIFARVLRVTNVLHIIQQQSNSVFLIILFNFYKIQGKIRLPPFTLDILHLEGDVHPVVHSKNNTSNHCSSLVVFWLQHFFSSWTKSRARPDFHQGQSMSFISKVTSIVLLCKSELVTLKS